MFDIAQKLQILIRIEKIRMRLAGRALMGQAMMLLMASILAVGGLAMFSLALYLVISSQYGALIGAVATGGVLFVLAALLLLVARRFGRSAEGRTVDELEKLILAEIKSDFGQGQLPLKIIESGASALMSKNGNLPYLAVLVAAVFGFFSAFLKSRK